MMPQTMRGPPDAPTAPSMPRSGVEVDDDPAAVEIEDAARAGREVIRLVVCFICPSPFSSTIRFGMSPAWNEWFASTGTPPVNGRDQLRSNGARRFPLAAGDSRT